MLEAKIELFSKILRELESEEGTMSTAELVMDALVEAILALNVKDSKEFCVQFQKLFEVISDTRPKFGILKNNFAVLLDELEKNICPKKLPPKKWKQMIIKRIESVLRNAHAETRKILAFAEKLSVEGKTILIHDHSHTVHDVLTHLKNIGRKFNVVIAEQDHEKTNYNIDRMHAAGISFRVVPAYMLSHIHKQVDMLFFGALTLKDTMDFVMDPGTDSLIAEFNSDGIHSYMFIDTAKFSLWKSQKRDAIFIHEYLKKHVDDITEYVRVKYSHDRVPAKFFKKIITNEGVFSPIQLKRLFDKKFKEASK